MATMNDLNCNIRWNTRDCEVDGRYGYFHTWEQYSEIIPPSLLKGGHSGGVVSGIFGIVEFPEGIERVNPDEIKFIDQDHADLVIMSNHMKELKEKKDGNCETV